MVVQDQRGMTGLTLESISSFLELRAESSSCYKKHLWWRYDLPRRPLSYPAWHIDVPPSRRHVQVETRLKHCQCCSWAIIRNHWKWMGDPVQVEHHSRSPMRRWNLRPRRRTYRTRMAPSLSAGVKLSPGKRQIQRSVCWAKPLIPYSERSKLWF